MIRQVREREIAAEALAERDILRRRHEIDSQILNALEVGNSFHRLWRHPAGINPARNRGCCPPLHKDLGQENTYCENRYNQLKAKFEAGREFEDLDAEIAGEVKAGKRKGDPKVDRLSAIKVRGVRAKRGERGEQERRFARARALKDVSLFHYEEEGLRKGWLRELGHEEIVAEHEANVVQCIEQINAEREKLGLGRMKIVEE